jgi:peptide/nickel transport system substrate-binding protein
MMSRILNAGRRRGVSGLAGLLLLGIGATGCGGGAEASGSTADPGKPVRGGNLLYLDAEIPISAQVQESGYWQDRAILQNVTDRLLYRNAKTNEIEPWIAQSWTVSPDGRTYEFVIKKGVTFSDGTPLDVESVKRNLEWQIKGDPKNAVAPNKFFPKEAAITTDAARSTVTVALKQPWAPFLGALTTWSAGLVADKTIKANRDDQTRFINLIGSGPFVVTTETYGRKYVLTRRAGYAWAPKSAPNQGESYVDTVTILPVQEDAVRLGTLKSGQAHLLRYIQPSEEKALAKQGFKVVARSGVGLSNQWFVRQSADFTADGRVRKAVLVGIDRQRLIKDLYTENWSAATGLFSPGTVGYTDESAKLAYDPATANKLLDEAGWTTKDADGFRTKDGKRLNLLTYVDVFDNTARASAQAIQSQLKEIGINLDLNQTDYSSYSATAWGNPKVALLRTGWPNPDPGIDLFNQYGPAGDTFALKGSDKELNRLLAAPLTAPDQEQEKQALSAVQDYILDKAYAIPVINDTQVYVAAPKLHGFDLNDGGLPEYHNAWLTR